MYPSWYYVPTIANMDTVLVNNNMDDACCVDWKIETQILTRPSER